MADYFRMLDSRLDEQEKRFNSRFDEREKRFNNRFDEQEKRSDSRYEALQEDLRITNQRLEELELRVPRPRLADVGIQEGKSGELEGIATEAREMTPPEPQRQQPLLPSQSSRLLP